MKKSNKTILFIFLSILPIFFLSCSGANKLIYNDADTVKFDNNVSSETMKKDIRDKTLDKGMPFFIFRQVLEKYYVETRTVASYGSTQNLVEKGDYEMDYVDPNIKKYLDIYETPKGSLLVWYGYEDFSSRELERNDTILLFFDSNIIDTITVDCILGPYKLTTNKTLDKGNVKYTQTSQNSNTYKTSYYYNVDINDVNIRLKTVGNDLYPVYKMKLDNSFIKSFKFK